MSSTTSSPPPIKEPRQPISSTVWAAIVAGAIAVWLLSGQLASTAGNDEAASVDTPGDEPAALFRVSTKTLRAIPRPTSLIIRGQTKSPARVEVRAETPGMVNAISNRKGQPVKKGDLLCSVELGARPAVLLEAKAALTQAETEYKSSSKLSRRGFTATSKKVADKARLDAAKATLKRAELDIFKSRIIAPFAGIIEAQHVKPGGYLRQADPCATLVRLDPILMTGAVSEQDLAKLNVGMKVAGTLVTGQTAVGKITFISPSSDPTTRTFAFEAQAANTERAIRAGITTDIKIDLTATKAHQLTASALSLSDSGEVGVKIVDDQARAIFTPVTVLSNEKNAVWVSGLPDLVTVITVGHEFVTQGQKVEAVPQSDPAPGNADRKPKA